MMGDTTARRLLHRAARWLPGLTIAVLAILPSAAGLRLLWLMGTGRLAASPAGWLGWGVFAVLLAIAPWWALVSARAAHEWRLTGSARHRR